MGDGEGARVNVPVMLNEAKTSRPRPRLKPEI